MVTAKVKAVGNAERDEWPDLSDDERDRRWREVRWRMDMAGLDCLLVWGNESKWQSALANNRYLTGRVAPVGIRGRTVRRRGLAHRAGSLDQGGRRDRVSPEISRARQSNGRCDDRLGATRCP